MREMSFIKLFKCNENMLKMKRMRFVGLCLLGLMLVACQEKREDIEPVLEQEGLAEDIRQEGYVPFLETSFAFSEEGEDQLKAVDMTFDETIDADGTRLRSPRLKFTQRVYRNNQWVEENIPSFPAKVLLRRAKGNDVEFVTHDARAEVLSTTNGARRANVRIWILTSNPEYTKSFFSLKNGETWHAMFILEHEQNAPKDRAYFGESISDKNTLNPTEAGLVKFIGRNQAAGTGTHDSFHNANPHDYGADASMGTHQIPLISNWQELEVKSGATNADHANIPSNRPNVLVRLAKNTNFTIKPQGIILNYQITANVYEGVDIRSAGIISNALDFQGYYKLDAESLKAAFDAKKSDGFGVPAWVGMKSELKPYLGLSMYKPSAADLEMGFPWDMPVLSYRFSLPIKSRNLPGPQMTETVQEGDVSIALFRAGRIDGDDYPKRLVGFLVGATVPYTSDKNLIPGSYSDIAHHLQWAMPKEQTPAQPFTYLWVHAHSAHSPEEYFTNTTSSLYIAPQYESQGYVNFLKQPSFRSQKSIVVHQTNADFKNQIGKTPRLYATLTADLMISEVVYKKQNGHNYSVVELQNASKLPIDLNNYALARIVFAGDAPNTVPQFAAPNGETTHLIEQAELYRLSNIKDQCAVAGYGPKDGMFPTGGTNVSAQTPPKEGELPYHQLEVDGKKRLEAGQIVLIGAEGYLNLKPSYGSSSSSWWNDFFPREQQTKWYDDERRMRYFVATRSSVLKINPGTVNDVKERDGLVLVKFINGKRKIIDATAPVLRDWVAFAGTIGDYKKEMAKTEGHDYYCLKRKDGVVFPFIEPYRTAKVTTDWTDDWELNLTPNSHKLGHRWFASMDGAQLPPNKISRLHRDRSFVEKRTSIGNPERYKNSRPTHR